MASPLCTRPQRYYNSPQLSELSELEVMLEDPKVAVVVEDLYVKNIYTVIKIDNRNRIRITTQTGEADRVTGSDFDFNGDKWDKLLVHKDELK